MHSLLIMVPTIIIITPHSQLYNFGSEKGVQCRMERNPPTSQKLYEGFSANASTFDSNLELFLVGHTRYVVSRK